MENLKKFQKNLEKQVINLKNNLKNKEEELANVKLRIYKEELISKQDDYSREEIEIILHLLFGYYLTKEYCNNHIPEIYLNKASELLDDWPETIEKNYSELFKKYEEYETSVDDDIVQQKLEYFIEKSKLIEECDDIMDVFIPPPLHISE